LLQSTDRKIGIINKLFSAAEGEEAKFLIRSLEGKLRIRLAEKSVIVALANAVVLSRNGESGDGRREGGRRRDETDARLRSLAPRFLEQPTRTSHPRRCRRF